MQKEAGACKEMQGDARGCERMQGCVMNDTKYDTQETGMCDGLISFNLLKMHELN